MSDDTLVSDTEPVAADSPTPPAAAQPQDVATGTASPPPSGWRASLPAEFQSHPSLAKFKDGEWTETGPELVRSLVNAQKLIGERGAKAAEVPAEPKGYAEAVKLPDPGKGRTWHPDLVDSFYAEAHTLGLTPAQVQGLMGLHVKTQLALEDKERAARGAQADQQKAAAVAALEAEWGPKDGPTYQHKVGRAQDGWREAAESAGLSDEAINRILERNGDDPDFVRVFALIGDRSLEHAYIAADARQRGMSREDHRKAGEQLMAKLLGMDRQSAEYETTRAAMQKEFDLAFPEAGRR